MGARNSAQRRDITMVTHPNGCKTEQEKVQVAVCKPTSKRRVSHALSYHTRTSFRVSLYTGINGFCQVQAPTPSLISCHVKVLLPFQMKSLLPF